MEKIKKGVLYLVSTPLGNLGDITIRALEVLRNSSYIVCEDTRISQKLFNAFEIKPQKKIIYNDINKEKSVERIISLIKDGNVVSQVTDAGTPLISDPGYILVNRLIEEGLDIVPVPGVSAPIAALSASGFPGNDFYFAAFPPRSGADKFWKNMKAIKSILIFFESPNRILKTLEIINEIFGNISGAVCRELTKVNEEIIRGKISEIIDHLKKKEKIRGEITFLINNKSDKNEKTGLITEKMKEEITELKSLEFSNKEIIKILGVFNSGKIKKNKVYSYLIKEL